MVCKTVAQKRPSAVNCYMYYAINIRRELSILTPEHIIYNRTVQPSGLENFRYEIDFVRSVAMIRVYSTEKY